MAEANMEQQTAGSPAGAPLREGVRIEQPAQVLDQSLGKLAKFGGFDFLEAGIDGVQSLNPERKARKNIFLTDSSKKKEREDLKKKLNLWLDLLQSSNDISEMADTCVKKSDEAA